MSHGEGFVLAAIGRGDKQGTQALCAKILSDHSGQGLAAWLERAPWLRGIGGFV